MPQTSRDHLGRVARVVPLEDLEHAARVLQRLVALRLGRAQGGPPLPCSSPAARTARWACSPALPSTLGVRPGRRVVLAGLGVEAGEQAVELLGVAEVLVDQGRGVGVGDDVVLEMVVGRGRS